IPQFKDRAVAVIALGGGITNRNFRVSTGAESFVLRIGGENTELLGIDRGQEHACSRAAAASGVRPEVIAFVPEHQGLGPRFVDASVLTAEDVRQPDVMRRVIKALRTFHNGTEVPGRFSAFAGVRDYYTLAREHSVSFPGTIGDALDLLAILEEKLAVDKLYPCHNDLLPSNLLDDGRSIQIIDWEYAGMGDRFFDLGNLAANGEFQAEHEEMLIELYFGAANPDHLA